MGRDQVDLDLELLEKLGHVVAVPVLELLEGFPLEVDLVLHSMAVLGADPRDGFYTALALDCEVDQSRDVDANDADELAALSVPVPRVLLKVDDLEQVARQVGARLLADSELLALSQSEDVPHLHPPFGKVVKAFSLKIKVLSMGPIIKDQNLEVLKLNI